MTRQEARKIATAMNKWRRADTIYPMPCTPAEFGIAIDVLTQPNTIAENIRQAAINWPEFLGNIEWNVLDAFAKNYFYKCNLIDALAHPLCSDSLQIQSRTFMLFVAEALDS